MSILQSPNVSFYFAIGEPKLFEGFRWSTPYSAFIEEFPPWVSFPKGGASARILLKS